MSDSVFSAMLSMVFSHVLGVLVVVSFLVALIFGPACFGLYDRKNRKEKWDEAVESVPDLVALFGFLIPVLYSHLIFGELSVVVFIFWFVAGIWIFFTYWLGLSIPRATNAG